MYIYVKRSVRGFYIELEDKLSPEDYNNLGETYEDFVDDKFVLLSDEQVAFHEEHPNASVREVLLMEEPPVPVRDLEAAKREMLAAIRTYDNSLAVNGFTINGVIEAWLKPEERTNYKNSVDSAKLLGVNTLSFFVNDMALEVATDKAEQMLAALQLYADACFLITKKHELAVAALETIEEVDGYDYRAGYPERLNFDLA